MSRSKKTRICANPECRKEFHPSHKNQLYCSIQCSHAKVNYIKKCVICGKEFTARSKLQKFCSKKCKIQNMLNKREKYTKTCPHCGKVFECYAPAQIYCSNRCCTLDRREKMKKRQKKRTLAYENESTTSNGILSLEELESTGIYVLLNEFEG